MKRAALLIALAAGLWCIHLLNRDKPSTIHEECPCPLPYAAPVPELDPVEAAKLTVIRDTSFDLHFGRPETEPMEDLRLLSETLTQSRLLIKNFADLPLAENADFTRFLSGANPHRVAWIRPGHPSINPAGELTDRWGTPIFFHQESSSRTTLRSAGPDRVFWNDDDLLLEDNETIESRPEN